MLEKRIKKQLTIANRISKYVYTNKQNKGYMKNPFLQLLEDPASLITVEFDKSERETIVRMLEEKINNAMAEYKNPEQHDYYTGKGAMGFAYNEWLHYLDTQWDGKLNRTFEMFAEGIGLQRNELYKMIIGLLLDKHLDYVCEHETNIDDDTLNALRINHNIHVEEPWHNCNLDHLGRDLADDNH